MNPLRGGAAKGVPRVSSDLQFFLKHNLSLARFVRKHAAELGVRRDVVSAVDSAIQQLKVEKKAVTAADKARARERQEHTDLRAAAFDANSNNEYEEASGEEEDEDDHDDYQLPTPSWIPTASAQSLKVALASTDLVAPDDTITNFALQVLVGPVPAALEVPADARVDWTQYGTGLPPSDPMAAPAAVRGAARPARAQGAPKRNARPAAQQLASTQQPAPAQVGVTSAGRQKRRRLQQTDEQGSFQFVVTIQHLRRPFIIEMDDIRRIRSCQSVSDGLISACAWQECKSALERVPADVSRLPWVPSLTNAMFGPTQGGGFDHILGEAIEAARSSPLWLVPWCNGSHHYLVAIDGVIARGGATMYILDSLATKSLIPESASLTRERRSKYTQIVRPTSLNKYKTYGLQMSASLLTSCDPVSCAC